MFFSSVSLVVSIITSLCVCSVNSSDLKCSKSFVLTPSRLVVKFGDPASVTCVVCELQDGRIGFETPLGKVTTNSTTAVWTVDKMTEWDISPMCFYDNEEQQFTASLPVTVYQPPQQVSFSFMGNNETLESGEHTLQCSVSNVAPAEHLAVTFYRGQTPLGQVKTIDTMKEPVSKTFTLSYNISKEEDGAQFWCEARLELGPGGPQTPPVVKSGAINPTVHCLKTSCEPTDEATSLLQHALIVYLMLLVSVLVEV